jgi:hypothetical protein
MATPVAAGGDRGAKRRRCVKPLRDVPAAEVAPELGFWSWRVKEVAASERPTEVAGEEAE